MAEPVHTTEIRTYMACKLKWWFSAPPPRGLYLTPKVKKQELRIGSMAHAVLMKWYDRQKGDDIELLVEDEVQKYIDKQGVTWPELREQFEEEGELLKTMLSGYADWSQEVDANCTILATESPWQVKHGIFLRMAGKFDGIIQRPDGLWVLEFKTTGSKPGSTGWAGRALQNVSYAIAAQKLYGDEVRGVLYRFLRKKKPYTYEDMVLKRGGLTQRSNIAELTTKTNYHKALMVGAYRELFEHENMGTTVGDVRNKLKELSRREGGIKGNYPKLWERYRMWCAAHQDALSNFHGQNNPFFWEQEEYSTHQQRTRYLEAVIKPMMKEMVHQPFPTPTGLGVSWAMCGRCSFRTPCDMLLTGGDWRGELQRSYIKRSDYEADNR